MTIAVDFACGGPVHDLLIRDDLFDVLGADYHTLARIDSAGPSQQFAFAPDARELSVEEGIAQRLGWKLGDELTFNVGGETFSARVSSLRKLRWDSMKINFFVIAPPRVLAAFPASYVSAFRLEPGKEAVVNELAARFPNLTVVDIGPALRQAQGVIDQMIGADYWRVRIGIGHPGVKELVHPYVLQNFAADEMRDWVEKLVDVVADTVPLLLDGAPQAFMSEVARRCPAPGPEDKVPPENTPEDPGKRGGS